ncbi:hypothetical protein [Roseibium sp. RKSG952]|uniref:hypothetical protein n=1 Tax=Roseibium sp. RKSG952 TaxID=2529384 RepID=UPI0012BBE249|nr:hypothetical protein [Roseibium sp. RKSG952]MTH97909.1 hypothetical protein [Roseibium sp. RKSG952]
MVMETRNSTRGSFVRRAFSRMIDARAAQAQRYVNGYLLSLDDATLAAHGYDRAELEREGASSMVF